MVWKRRRRIRIVFLVAWSERVKIHLNLGQCGQENYFPAIVCRTWAGQAQGTVVYAESISGRKSFVNGISERRIFDFDFVAENHLK